jgi:TrmH family RNA methyltransferase
MHVDEKTSNYRNSYITTQQTPMDLLSRIRVVLVGTKHPGNIGSAARAMKTMGLRELVLVAPHAFPDERAEALAVGAADILAQARVVSTLAEAVADCARVVASSARPRHIQVATSEPRVWAQSLAASGTVGRVALLFGRERTGLSNEELDFAQELVTIPTAPDYSSLNIAAAVQIFSYELRLASGAASPEIPEHVPAPQADLERFYVHLEEVLIRTQFLNPDNPRLLMRRLRRLYARAAPDMNEVNILRGILTSVQDSLARVGARNPEA